MVYSDTTTKNGLIQSCERYCNLGDAGISSNTQRLYDFTAFINNRGKKIWELIFSVHSGWTYDDSNQTDLPQATTGLTDGTGVYAIPTDALTIKRVEIKDENGDWNEIKPIVLENINMALEEFCETDGQPMYYRL